MRRTVGLIVLAVAVVTAMAAAGLRVWRPERRSPVPSRYRAAIRSLQSGDAAAAERALRQSIAEDPLFADAYAELGNLYLGQQSYSKAIQALETASFLNPRRPHIFCQMAQAYLDARRRDEAVQRLRVALEAAPECPHGLSVQGELLLRDDDLTGSLAAFRSALRAAPAFALAYLKAGYVLLKLQRLEEAEAMLQAGLAHDPHNPGLHSLLAETYFLRPQLPNSIELAEKHYQQAIPNNPSAAEPNSRLAELAWRRADAPLARTHWNRALELEPTLTDALYGLAQLEARAGNRDKSRVYLDRYRFVRRAQNQLAALNARALARAEDAALACKAARLCLERGFIAEAERHLARAIRWQPERREARELRGLLNLKQGRVAEAREEFAVASTLRSQKSP